MADNATANLRRELAKAREALRATEVHLTHHAAMNAALHLSDNVMYSPLHAKVQATIHGIDLVLAATENTDA